MNKVSLRVVTGTGIGVLTVLLAGWVNGASTSPAAAQVSLTHASPIVERAVSYGTDIQPIFDTRCVRCHGGVDEGETRLEAALNLTSYDGVMAGSEFGTVVEAGDAEGSILLEMVVAGDMPEEGDPATAEEISKIREWITGGAQNN